MNCPSCNTPDAYIGFIVVECQNKKCIHYVETAVEKKSYFFYRMDGATDWSVYEKSYLHIENIHSKMQRWLKEGHKDLEYIISEDPSYDGFHDKLRKDKLTIYLAKDMPRGTAILKTP